MFTVVGEMQGEMAGPPSTSGSRACCRAAFILPPGQSTQGNHQHLPWPPHASSGTR